MFNLYFQVMIPLSLYVTIEIIKLGQVYFIHEDSQLYDKVTDKKLECRALNITEELGQVEYVFSDKTGTLTENNMVFRRCTIGGVDYDHELIASRSANGMWIWHVSCFLLVFLPTPDYYYFIFFMQLLFCYFILIHFTINE